METEITKRGGSSLDKMEDMQRSILYDRRMPVKLKGKVYKTVIRPAMLHGTETWATTKRQEKRIEVTEMRMLRWMCGVTRKDEIRNEHIRGKTRVAQASKKITERRLNWYGHVMRRDGEHILRKVLRADIPGKRKRGRPKTRWKHTCQRDLKKYLAESRRGDGQGDVEKKYHQLYRRPYMMGKARGIVTVYMLV